MKLYCLKNFAVGYDEQQGCVVRATSEEDARRIAAANKGDEGDEVWLDPSLTTCEVVSGRGPRGLILRAYNAG